MRILNVSRTLPGAWHWFDGKLPAELNAEFWHCHAGADAELQRKPLGANLALHRGCAQAAYTLARNDIDVLVTHVPVITKWTEIYRRATRKRPYHIAFSFNHTPMPEGAERLLWKRIVKEIDRFVVFSTAEQQLYADAFDIPLERITMMPWGVVPPRIDGERPPVVEGDYVASIGRTGRNWVEFMEAMRRLPKSKAVVVAGRGAMDGIDVPPNVDVRVEIPFADTLNILAHSRGVVLPLFPADVPYGHGTAVLGMHLGAPVVVTAGDALADYVQHGVTGLMYESGNVDELCAHISSLLEDTQRRDSLATAAHAFAHEQCTEDKTLERVVPFLRDAQRRL